MFPTSLSLRGHVAWDKVYIIYCTHFEYIVHAQNAYTIQI